MNRKLLTKLATVCSYGTDSKTNVQYTFLLNFVPPQLGPHIAVLPDTESPQNNKNTIFSMSTFVSDLCECTDCVV